MHIKFGLRSYSLCLISKYRVRFEALTVIGNIITVCTIYFHVDIWNCSFCVYEHFLFLNKKKSSITLKFVRKLHAVNANKVSIAKI